MPLIDRTEYDELVDDDGSGAIGTPWNKTEIADVILDPVDACLAEVDTDLAAVAADVATLEALPRGGWVYESTVLTATGTQHDWSLPIHSGGSTWFHWSGSSDIT